MNPILYLKIKLFKKVNNMFFNDNYVQWTVKIRSHSYSERINKLTLGICSNNLNGIYLVISMV